MLEAGDEPQRAIYSDRLVVHNREIDNLIYEKIRRICKTKFLFIRGYESSRENHI